MPALEQPSESAPEEPEPVRITRYPNRRLYARNEARYVTLQEIAELVRRGQTVMVRDSKTDEDLTRSILTQIILEYHPERMELFPIHLLNAMIRTNEEVLTFLREYLRQSLNYLELFQKQEAIHPLLHPLNWMRMFLPSVGPQPPSANADPVALTQRIAELERRLDEFQDDLRKRGKKPGAQEKKTGKEAV